MNTCKFPATCKFPSQQQLRAMALRAQLLAIDAQVSALTSMDREHSLGIEAGNQLDRTRKSVHDFLRDVLSFAEGCDDISLEQTRSTISVLAMRSGDLKKESENLKETGVQLARFRFNLTNAAASVPTEIATAAPADAEKIASTAGTPAAAEVLNTAVPAEVTRLQIKADYACLRAEVDEYAALALQIHALCNLSLEFCFNAAVKCTKCNP